MKRLVVFDLDQTLWSLPGGYCAQMSPPFERDGDRVRDASGYELRLRPDARSTLDALAHRGLMILFVDDWPSNVRDAAKLGISGLVFGRDIHELSEILNHLNGSGDNHAIRSL